jgi:segregation and condensation protein B
MPAAKPAPKIDPPTPDRLPAVLESLLFVAEEPQEIGTLARSLGVPRQRIEHAVEQLADSANGRGLFVQRHGDRVQLATTPDAAPYIEQFLEVEHGRLSRASLETLAIIAYRQPATRAVIESVRGVNSDHAVASLLARGLIEEVGRAPGPGRPVLLGTSVRFLEYFGLQRPDDLPPLPELTAARVAENALEAEGPDGEPSPEDEPAPAAEAVQLSGD